MAKGSFGFTLTIALAAILCLALHAESRVIGEHNGAKKKSWCVANPFAPASVFQDDIDIICKQLNCSVIAAGGDCYDPNTLYNHASVVLNLYYRKHQSQRSACDFHHSALISSTDPSSEKCKYP